MKRRSRYDWDEHNEGHVAAHRVETSEVEEALANDPIRIETRKDTRSGEERILELGRTNAGRVLFVVWTPRGERMRPIAAFDANRKTAPPTRGDAMEKNHNKRIEAEAAFAADIYRDRAAVNRKAQGILASGSRQITIRLGNDELARARWQAEAKGLKYQTYIKMLLHEALARNSSA
jgi:predicted DNA binding CopG/RHH family protein/uncharacterized DUF497 family protein